MFPSEMSTWPPQSYLDRMFNVKQLTKMSKGGHFAAMEQPDLLIQDVVKFAKTIR
jgi:microsomal epoxide hydrolase